MVDIDVISSEETDTGYRFEVAVDQAGRRSDHTITMSSADYERWGSEGGLAPATVARRSVEVLLRRVGPERLPEHFDVRDAMQLYPAFEAEAHRSLE
jgi:hypothetical protein